MEFVWWRNVALDKGQTQEDGKEEAVQNKYILTVA
jgi:hypothetical protein